MKQKLFSILALLLMAVTGAWAADKVLINFPTAGTGIGVAGTSSKSTVKVNKNTTTLDSYKLANGYNSGGSYTGNSIVLSVDGGFKKGDVITIAGAINNSDASKRATAVLFTLGASENITILNIFSDFINGQLVETMPVEESYTLETDAETLYLGRDGGTGANLTTIKVVRPAPAGLTTYSVTLTEGTEDADKWTISPASAAEGETVTITYTGTKRVKDVKVAAVPTDLSMVDCAGAARTAMSTANCYMVHTAGAYKLPLVYGNAIKDGAANSAAWTGVGGNSTATFPNHAGTAIDAPWITKAATGEGVDKGMGIAVDKAELLWQDAQGLVTAVGIDGDYLTLTVGKDAATQQGNALVAAKDADGNIVWSWHIWVTTETFANLTTVATGNHTYSVTPVNLGWVPTGGDGKQGYNTYYQWGRKDAFIPGTGNANVYDISNAAVTGLTYTASTSATIADNIKNPTTHYYNSSNRGPCNTTYYNMWDAKQTSTGNITTATVKTVYDPCPAGFCVPTGNLYNFMGNNGYRTMTTWDGDNKGTTWDNTVVANSVTGNALFFPASGCRNSSNGALSLGVGYCWSASPGNVRNGRNLEVTSSYWRWGSSYRAAGYSVRAVAEE